MISLFKDWVRAFEPFFESKSFEGQKLIVGEPKPVKTVAAPAEVSNVEPMNSIFGASEHPVHPVQVVRRYPIASTAFLLYPDADASQVKEQEMRRPDIMRGFRNQSTRPSTLSWPEDDTSHSNENKPKVPIRGSGNAMGNRSSAAPFAREGDVVVPKSITGIPRTPERRGQRIPFGTEADWPASFANGVAPQNV